MPPRRTTGIISEGNASPGDPRQLAQRHGLLDGEVLPARGDGDDDHLAERHQQAGDDAAEEEEADRGVGDERVEHHRDRGRDDRADHRRDGRHRRRVARRVAAVAGHHDLHHAARAGRIGDGRARHAGEDDALQDVDLREPAAEAADERVAEGHQPVGHAADVHELGREDEQRHREDDVVRVHAVEQLLGGRAHVLACEQQVEDRARDHRMADRQAEKGERGDRDEREREGACEVHTPELALVGSNSSGATPRKACQASQR